MIAPSFADQKHLTHTLSQTHLSLSHTHSLSLCLSFSTSHTHSNTHALPRPCPDVDGLAAFQTHIHTTLGADRFHVI